MHIFKYSLRTNDTKVRCNVVYKLVESRRAVCSTNMKVSFMRGDLPMRRGHQPQTIAPHHEASLRYQNPTRTAGAGGVHRRVNGEQTPPR